MGSLKVGRGRHILLVEHGHLRAERVADPGHVAGLEEDAGLVLLIRRPEGLLSSLGDAVRAYADGRLGIRVVVVRKVDPVPLALGSWFRMQLESL